MSSRLSEIFNSAIEEEEDELEIISNQNIVKDIEVVLNPPDNQNSGPPMTEGNSTLLNATIVSYILASETLKFLEKIFKTFKNFDVYVNFDYKEEANV